jgi:hypothetical protein
MQIKYLSTFLALVGGTFAIYRFAEGYSNEGHSQHALTYQDSFSPDQPSTLFSKPFYIIAHRVLTTRGVRNAVEDGANTIEIDVTPQGDKGWAAEHPGIAGSKGDPLRDLFKTVVEQVRGGREITFVWLDIKDAGLCHHIADRVCSVLRLQDLLREYLKPHRVKVLYGVSEWVPGSIVALGESIDHNEAVGIDCAVGGALTGSLDSAIQLFFDVQEIKGSRFQRSSGSSHVVCQTSLLPLRRSQTCRRPCSKELLAR